MAGTSVNSYWHSAAALTVHFQFVCRGRIKATGQSLACIRNTGQCYTTANMFCCSLCDAKNGSSSLRVPALKKAGTHCGKETSGWNSQNPWQEASTCHKGHVRLRTWWPDLCNLAPQPILLKPISPHIIYQAMNSEVINRFSKKWVTRPVPQGAIVTWWSIYSEALHKCVRERKKNKKALTPT